jgi:dGTPase
MAIQDEIMKNNEKAEEMLAEYACKSSQAIRFKEENREGEFNVRPSFFRDADRILHSTAYVRYMDKTQVFSLFNNDQITHRGLHVQFVAKIARTIGRSLSLNEDLIEAIALGHDLGHVPFGHSGERFLNKICQNNKLGYFAHNAQSVRVLQTLENKGKGLNISLQVLDGILCHNGEIVDKKFVPDFNKTKEQFMEEYDNCWKRKNSRKIRPMTLEGCVVRISDIIAYIGRDIEDAILVKLIKREDLPDPITRILGNKNSTIIDSLVEDLINNSYGKPYLEFSEKKFKALKMLLEFNSENIYHNPKKESNEEKFETMFVALYDKYIYDLKNNVGEIFDMFYIIMDKDYTKQNLSGKIVVDFIAGMTDKFFIEQYRKNFLPKTFDMTI